MANRMKEDEKNEKIIRGLLKLAPNRRCINCHSLGPQYVCTNFWTFVCTTCSGIHREFTHRVKSISMAKFSSQEVSALQAGGNERAKEFYFKEWDPQRHSVPDSSNVDRLRDFIKHVYVDRRYTGERSTDRPPRIKGDDTYRGDSRSPPYEDTYGSRYNERSAPGSRYSYDERRSPGYEQENRRYSDVYRRSPRRFEIVDDRVRDDRFGNGNQNWKSEDRRFSEGPSKQGERSPNHQKDPEMSSPPMVRPVRDILGDDTPPLRVGDPPKSNGGRSIDGSAQTQRTTSSSSMGSADGNSVELKRANSGSLIDFNVDPEPPVATVSQDPFSGQSAPQPTATPLVDGGNWASFDFATQEKVHQASSNALAPVSALSQLEALVTPAAATLPTLSVGGGLDSLARPTSVGQGPTIQQHQSSLFNMPVGEVPKNQIWMSCVGPNAQVNAPVPITAQTAQLSQVVPMQPQETTAGVQSLPPPVEAKQSGRQALPEDLFSGAPVSAPVWRSVPPQAMGFGTQYPTATLQAMQAFPQMSKSTNPFDLVNEPIPVRAPTFPSMVSLQGALPNIAAPSPLLRSSSFGAPSPQWVPQSPSYPSTLPPGAYMAQQAPNSMVPLGQHGIASFGGEGAAFGTYGAGQRPPLRGSLPSTPNSFSSLGGNPFG